MSSDEPLPEVDAFSNALTVNDQNVIAVPAGRSVKITSSKNSSGQQCFEVWRYLTPFGWQREDPNPEAGEERSYFAFSETSYYRIAIWANWPPEAQNNWKPSRMRRKYENGGRTIIFESEDFWSTDNDWNDCIVYFNML
jgi:hypothetical protein